ncbi:hypothetical protein F4680DRAFT_155346 [Xylaria scruposa]|nr:hypothetical protein F4680DRAFT_155346 [Xylaria scruposa]
MAIEMHSIQEAYAPGDACLIEEYPPSTRPCIRSQLGTTRPCLMPDGSITVSPPSPTTKMKALPQRPGPGGSRVIRKRSSIPHLGDGLLTVFSSNVTPTKSAVYIEPDVSATLTSNNLNQLAKSTHPDGDFVFNGTPSMCSDEDIVLIGTPNQSINSNSSSRLSSGSGTPWGADTPPTTLTGDDSSFCSDDEITLGSSSSTPVNSKTVSSTRYNLPPTYKSNDSAARTKLLSPIAFSFFEKDGNAHGPYPRTCRPAHKPSDLFETVSVDTVVETVPSTEIIPDIESLHGIVRGFLAAETKVKSASPLIAETLPSLSPGLEAVDKAKPFWNPERLFAFYIKGAITPAKAKETAKRHGYLDVIPVIDEAEALKKKNPSLDISDIITTAGNEGHFGVLDQPTGISATTSQDQHDTVYHDFMLKLATYSAEDNSAGSAKPLHIFVDMSNIHIGFCNSWKISQNIPVDRRIRAPSFNFKVLASIMERNRAAEKKVLASSVASHIVSKTQWPQHFVDAEKHGYKTSILNRVQKVSPVKAGRRRRISAQGPGVAYPINLMTSGDESGEDTAGVSYETRNGEQGVDEILHLNMMNSIVDKMQEPSSMILATGDAAQAEFSEGFLEYANRALSQGWNLELVTWKATISSAWMNPAFRSKHGKRFRIIYLDDFLDELNADLRPSLA